MIQPVGRVRLRRPRLHTTPSVHVVGSGRIDASGSKRRALAVWRLLRFGTFEATAAPRHTRVRWPHGLDGLVRPPAPSPERWIPVLRPSSARSRPAAGSTEFLYRSRELRGAYRVHSGGPGGFEGRLGRPRRRVRRRQQRGPKPEIFFFSTFSASADRGVLPTYVLGFSGITFH